VSKTWARPILGGLAALAALELVLGGLSYRDAIADADWDALAESVSQDDADGIRLATTWLGPVGVGPLHPSVTGCSAANPKART